VKIVSLAALLGILLASNGAKAAEVHQCAADAVKQAGNLMEFYLRSRDGTVDDRMEVEDRARYIGKVSAIRGKWRYDVLEVLGSVYKASYRMHIIYAVVNGECTMMGEEILEDAIL
jgi:hypothetical protein